jgi:hypothetical protein
MQWRIECPPEYAQEITSHIVCALVGKPIIFSDTMKDLVRRHCPEVYDMVASAGYTLIPDERKEPLLQKTPEFNWHIVKAAPALH